ncbi:ABC transporter substrate-binding protein [Mangrovimonas spongiae]|uniref:Cobalamin-binding protein n=1 Tax=Mangrovimonas spongiae TaxID=2494697 RepID=A0A3R9MHJ2_9FLAO|nr:helical backbone metal receptor [Mangrovimonas spongiae]RSK40668.1 cobalamin-binding protein [Mangrovimonas spongiae]
MQVKDQLHRTLVFQKAPKRIVSLVPSLTELLCDLGLKKYLVGVTKFCVHPKTIKKEALVVGGTKQVHLDKIQLLQPDIILCNKEENTQNIVEQCSQIASVHVSDIYTIDDCLELITMYGSIFNVERKAALLGTSISKAQKSFQDFILEKPVLNVAYFIWSSPWMVAGSDTFINYLLQQNNFKNVFASLKRYPEINLNDEKLTEVDVVLLSSEPYPFKKEHKETLEKQFPNTRVMLVDGEMFSWYGSRLKKAFSYFKRLHKSDLQ